MPLFFHRAPSARKPGTLTSKQNKMETKINNIKGGRKLRTKIKGRWLSIEKENYSADFGSHVNSTYFLKKKKLWNFEKIYENGTCLNFLFEGVIFNLYISWIDVYLHCKIIELTQGQAYHAIFFGQKSNYNTFCLKMKYIPCTCVFIKK